MKSKLMMIFYVTSFLSCKTSKIQEKENIRNKEKKEWIFAFKAKVFYKCFQQSGVIMDKDASPSLNFEVLGDFKILSKVDSIGQSHSKVINDRSAWLKGGDLDGYRAITNGCLSFFESKELDSIANSEYKKFSSQK